MILRKIFKFGATRSHLLRLKCTKFNFGWGSAPAPRPSWGSLQLSPDPLAGYERATSKGRKGKGGEGRGKEVGERRGKG